MTNLLIVAIKNIVNENKKIKKMLAYMHFL